jgi:hypothetical protein
MDRLNLKKLNKIEGKEQYRVDVSNKLISFQLWKSYQPRNSLVRDKNDDLLADSHTILIGRNTSLSS